MAVRQIEVANPTPDDVTVNAKTAHARRITVIPIDDAQAAPNDAFGFLAAGCALTSTTGSTFAEREEQGFIIEHEQQQTTT